MPTHNRKAHGLLYRLCRSLLMRWFSRHGWAIQEGADIRPKMVLCAAPHTSNWDLPYTLAIAFHYDIPISWVGKKSIFKWPFGGMMRALGGVSVDRARRADTVTQLAETITAAQDRFYLVIAPEGTRDAVKEWKSGFYHIALKAGVPIGLAFVDYKRQVGGIGPLFWPSGDYDADIVKIQDFYRSVTPRHPERSSLYGL
jgi:1-acyl-sn-glycerol-3-phosphate acyltransferase